MTRLRSIAWGFLGTAVCVLLLGLGFFVRQAYLDHWTLMKDHEQLQKLDQATGNVLTYLNQQIAKGALPGPAGPEPKGK